MFDVNLNQIELDTLYQLLESDAPGAHEKVIDMIETLVEMRYNRGKRQGATRFRDVIIDSIVSELKG